MTNSLLRVGVQPGQTWVKTGNNHITEKLFLYLIVLSKIKRTYGLIKMQAMKTKS